MLKVFLGMHQFMALRTSIVSNKKCFKKKKNLMLKSFSMNNKDYQTELALAASVFFSFAEICSEMNKLLQSQLSMNEFEHIA